MVDEVKILDVVSISGENVKKFDGECLYFSIGNLDFNKISNLEIVIYENKFFRVN